MTRVKICGIEDEKTAIAAVNAGADALGFVFTPLSRRCVSPETAASIIKELPPFVTTCGLFVNQEAHRINEIGNHCNIDLIQLHGDEDATFCQMIHRPVIKAARVSRELKSEDLLEYESVVRGFLLDAFSSSEYGGTGKSFDWDRFSTFRNLSKPLILAGGLNPENVFEAVKKTQPYAVDVSTGVEIDGVKNTAKIIKFIDETKKATNNL